MNSNATSNTTTGNTATSNIAKDVPLLEINNLSVHFRQGAHVTRAVDNVSLRVGRGETLGLVGESGSGKSTIGRAIVGLAPVTSGQIFFEGTETTRAKLGLRRELSAQMQMVFQDPYSSLNPAKTIGQTLAEPLSVHSQIGRSERTDRVAEMLRKVGMPTDAANRYPAQFSGGQRQRIAIARALMLSPKLVICDEPVSALDLSIQAQIMNLLADLQDELGVSYLFIAHDLAVVRHISHRTVVLYRGQIMEAGDAQSVADHPHHPYSEALVGAAPVADPDIQRERAAKRALLLASSTPRSADPTSSCAFASRCPHAIDRCWVERPTLESIDTHDVACLRAAERLQPIN
jgi:oligopeptide/dipeptide ABC transporter ATP-binding protein